MRYSYLITEIQLKKLFSYLSLFKPATLKSFRESVDKWETTHVLSTLKRSNTAQNIGLSAAPSAVVFHALDNIALIQNADIHSLFVERPPTARFKDWPEKPPAGLLCLLASRHTPLRRWAEDQISTCPTLASLSSNDPIFRVSAALVHHLQSLDQDPSSVNGNNSSLTNAIVDASRFLPPPNLWLAIPRLIRLIAAKDRLEDMRNLDGIDLASLVLGHLHDNDERQ